METKWFHTWNGLKEFLSQYGYLDQSIIDVEETKEALERQVVVNHEGRELICKIWREEA